MTISRRGPGTAVSVSMDMTEGIIARFRTMAIYRASVLIGHVVGSVLQSMLRLAVVVGVALAIGFRPGRHRAGVAGGLRAARAVRLGAHLDRGRRWAAGEDAEAASNTPMPLILLPLLSSAFVPADSMPPALRWFAEYQPFTPVIETLRGLLLGTPIGDQRFRSGSPGAGDRRWRLPVVNPDLQQEPLSPGYCSAALAGPP